MGRSNSFFLPSFLPSSLCFFLSLLLSSVPSISLPHRFSFLFPSFLPCARYMQNFIHPPSHAIPHPPAYGRDDQLITSDAEFMRFALFNISSLQLFVPQILHRDGQAPVWHHCDLKRRTPQQMLELRISERTPNPDDPDSERQTCKHSASQLVFLHAQFVLTSHFSLCSCSFSVSVFVCSDRLRPARPGQRRRAGHVQRGDGIGRDDSRSCAPPDARGGERLRRGGGSSSRGGRGSSTAAANAIASAAETSERLARGAPGTRDAASLALNSPHARTILLRPSGLDAFVLVPPLSFLFSLYFHFIKNTILFIS